jgi:hypothetical protein
VRHLFPWGYRDRQNPLRVFFKMSHYGISLHVDIMRRGRIISPQPKYQLLYVRYYGAETPKQKY